MWDTIHVCDIGAQSIINIKNDRGFNKYVRDSSSRACVFSSASRQRRIDSRRIIRLQQPRHAERQRGFVPLQPTVRRARVPKPDCRQAPFGLRELLQGRIAAGPLLPVAEHHGQAGRRTEEGATGVGGHGLGSDPDEKDAFPLTFSKFENKHAHLFHHN